MQQIAKDHSGKCLSKEYFNDESPLKWMCRKGHAWDASYTIIRQGGWCVQCIKFESQQEKLLELQLIAKKNGGKCLSKEYQNNHTKLKWKCKENHSWDATPRTIKYNSWCPYCSGNAPRTIEDMNRKAKENGGICLSKKYSDSQTKLWWQCRRQHKWQAKPNTIFRGSWCGKCARITQSVRQRNDIKVYQRYAEKNGGRLLTEIYLNSQTLMKWICRKKHVWYARGGQIANGSWCPYCAGKAKHTIEDMHRFAKQRNGKCLSKNYKNIYTKLLWECKNKHQWTSVPSNIIHNKTWCPVCAQKIKTLNLPQYSKAKRH